MLIVDVKGNLTVGGDSFGPGIHTLPERVANRLISVGAATLVAEVADDPGTGTGLQPKSQIDEVLGNNTGKEKPNVRKQRIRRAK